MTLKIRSDAPSAPFGTQIQLDGSTLIRLWAPDKKQVDIKLWLKDGSCHIQTMTAEKHGWHSLSSSLAGPDDRYVFIIDDILVPDPASRYQPEGAHGASQIINPEAYHWKCQGWQGRPWAQAVIYELHIGTFTEQGTFLAAVAHLDHLQQLGITCIELMPLADFSGKHNWGYDGVLMFAPDSCYGTPDELKALIDACHKRGIMILIDLVYNHFGPDGNYLSLYARNFFSRRHHTPWGNAINFDGKQSSIVRQFFIQNALYWLNEFRFDGIRFDAVQCIHDKGEPHFLEELATTLRQHANSSHVHLILENELNSSHYLNAKTAYNAQWNDDIHHVMHTLITGETFSYYSDHQTLPCQRLARSLAQGFDYQGEVSHFFDDHIRGESTQGLPLNAFVSFLQNHDRIGNRPYGERITQLASQAGIEAMVAIMLLSPQIPLLFMGEEWGAETPFLFFTDFPENLSTSVEQGRMSEFAKLPGFTTPEARKNIPNPCNPESFKASKLQWSERASPKSQYWLSFYRQLLQLRQSHLQALIQHANVDNSCFSVDERYIQVEWKIPNETWILTANLSENSLDRPPIFAGKSDSECIYHLSRHKPQAPAHLNSDASFAPWDVMLSVRR
ncbi:MAG: malto-oligosyltrehalose trehalohydrolase [Alteromonadaceae bacterium]|nr:MAG: malto-oligosyltrehalose trehalohydrolase [Alteromonadaceae bacterium]